jgi:hypothetical protein
MDRATGMVLERNGVEVDEALSGNITKTPTPYSGSLRLNKGGE